MVRIVLLDKNHEKAYSKYILNDPFSLYYYSLSYRNLLKTYLNAQDYYFIALENDVIKGVLPSFLSADKKFGSVINSLPFYGSNGGILQHERNNKIKKQLLDVFLNTVNEKRCVAATIITSPFEQDQKLYTDNIGEAFKDSRIGQITPLPSSPDNLMEIFDDPRPRNIRRAIKAGVTWKFSHDKEDMDFLFQTHQENIKKIGGIPKEKRFFDLVHGTVSQDDYKVVVGFLNGKRIAALLLFYYNKTVEYFTPVIIDKYRSVQPLSLLIYEAMKAAIAKKFMYWNWGGTWLTQKGVYDFKKKWGTKEYPYYYYTIINDKKVLENSKEELLKYFPSFYVLPFNKLKLNS